MADQAQAAFDYGPDGEAKLRAFVEQVTGGTITRFERQVRWRPAWFADVERNGETLRLHLRGDRQSDVVPFPDLQREADIMSVLGQNGINVPHIHGYCQDPPVIVMEAIDGTRDMSQASEAERRAITREYMAAVVAMHAVPVAPFAEKGILPPADLPLAGLEAYLPLYNKTKRKPEPLIEFAMAWVRRNAPRHRLRPSFVQFDSGQFLHANGRITGLYDFEFGMIGDPMVDLATMRMRDSYEPLGDEMRILVQHYEEFSGEPVDHEAVLFHTLQFSTVAMMQIAGAVAVPQPGGPHAVYLEWDVALRRVLMSAFSDCLGVSIPPEPEPAGTVTVNAALISMLGDVVDRIEASTELQGAHKKSAVELVECLVRVDRFGAEMERRNLADVSTLLDQSFADWNTAEAALERFVQTAGPELDKPLLQLFGAQEERRMVLYGPTHVGAAARRVFLPPTR